MQEDDKQKQSVTPEQRAVIRALFENAPATYPERYALFRLIREAVHEELATAIQPSFNEYFHGQPQHTTDECGDLVSAVNQQARFLGLSLRDPQGHPVSINADRKDAAHPNVVRFRLQRRDEHNRLLRTLTSYQLPELELMPDPPRVEGMSRLFRTQKGTGRTT